jgi:hypothetical protein
MCVADILKREINRKRSISDDEGARKSEQELMALVAVMKRLRQVYPVLGELASYTYESFTHRHSPQVYGSTASRPDRRLAFRLHHAHINLDAGLVDPAHHYFPR